MLIEFSVGNYRSYRDIQTLSMERTRLKARDPRVDEGNGFEGGDVKLLRTAALYGANASGKSNLVRAMEILRSMVLNSVKAQEGEALPAEPFQLSLPATNQPTHFEVVFWAEDKQFRYGVEFTSERITHEWLYQRALKKRKETLLFDRRPDVWKLTKAFPEGEQLSTKTRNNALFLSVCAQFNGPISTEALRWFNRFRVVNGLNSEWLRGETTNLMRASPQMARAVQALVCQLDLGVLGLKVQDNEHYKALPSDAPKELRDLVEHFGRFAIKTEHHQQTPSGETSVVEFDLELNESEGTKKLIAMSGPLLVALRDGGVLVVDEFDARLHPLISRELVRLFQNERSNPHNAQLIFATHDTNLLSRHLLRRDQIWFTEKNSAGSATALYALSDLRDSKDRRIRNDANYEPDYLGGRYGNLPLLGDLSSIEIESSETNGSLS